MFFESNVFGELFDVMYKVLSVVNTISHASIG